MTPASRSKHRPTAMRGALVAVGLVLSPVPCAANTGDHDPGAAARVYVGMWSTHIRDLSRGLRNNWLVGLGWRGFYGGTFINSFGNRSFTAGIQRMIARGKDETVVTSFSYRLGVVSGYDERFVSIASRVPVLPLAQVLGGIESGRTGVELGWAGLVATLGPSFRF